MNHGHTPGAEKERQASPGYGQPGNGALGPAPTGSPPPVYPAWALIAGICGVMFMILGAPAAIIGGRYNHKVSELWTDGHVQAAISASRKARGWLIASTVLDGAGLILFIAVITH
jgi:Interferon-induced transmembrane protein